MLSPSVVAQFKRDLLNQPIPDVVENWLFSGEIFGFAKHPKALSILETRIQQALGNAGEVTLAVVGSAKTGFSLKPEKAFAQFHHKSDIDLVVISSAHFDEAWEVLLKLYYQMDWLSLTDVPWTPKQRRRIWRGYVSPADWIREAQQSGLLTRTELAHTTESLKGISQRWFKTLQQVSTTSGFPHHTVKGRLYRTRAHAAMYHASGLELIKASLAKS